MKLKDPTAEVTAKAHASGRQQRDVADGEQPAHLVSVDAPGLHVPEVLDQQLGPERKLRSQLRVSLPPQRHHAGRLVPTTA
eukprot:3772320-Heterocapsa_arctica.AAC.1